MDKAGLAIVRNFIPVAAAPDNFNLVIIMEPANDLAPRAGSYVQRSIDLDVGAPSGSTAPPAVEAFSSAFELLAAACDEPLSPAWWPLRVSLKFIAMSEPPKSTRTMQLKIFAFLIISAPCRAIVFARKSQNPQL